MRRTWFCPWREREMSEEAERYELKDEYVCLSCYEKYCESCELHGEYEKEREFLTQTK